MSTGKPVRLDPEGSKRAMFFLELISWDSEGRIMAYLSGKFDAGLKRPRGLPPLFSDVDDEWVKCLGFERGTLIDFLDRENIPHELVRSTKPTSADTSALEQAGVRHEETSPERLPTEAGLSDSAEQSKAPTGLIMPEWAIVFSGVASGHSNQWASSSSGRGAEPEVRRVKERRDELDPAIDRAVEDANGSLETAEVWLKLTRLALNEFAYFTGGITKEGALEYTKYPEAGAPYIKAFKKRALDSRLRRRKQRVASGR